MFYSTHFSYLITHIILLLQAATGTLLISSPWHQSKASSWGWYNPRSRQSMGARRIRQKIYANASSIDSHRGGITGRPAQIMSPATYLTVSAASFTTPPNPGQRPPSPGNLLLQKWEAMKAAHQRRGRGGGVDEYTTSNNMDKAIKQQIIKAISEPIFIKPSENHIPGYSRITAHAVIQFLFNAYYGNITPLQLDANDKMMKEQCSGINRRHLHMAQLDSTPCQTVSGEIGSNNQWGTFV
jgi:hypothetical protein